MKLIMYTSSVPATEEEPFQLFYNEDLILEKRENGNSELETVSFFFSKK